jgi:hypothetical protein
MGEPQSGERADHGWSALDLQAKLEAKRRKASPGFRAKQDA